MTILRKKMRFSNQLSSVNFTIDQPILVVEDRPSIAQLLTTQLSQRWHCQVHLASNLSQAKALLKQHRQNYHLAICDLNLPDAPHGEVVDLMNRAHVPMIVLTGSSKANFQHIPSNANIIDYISKDSINSFSYVIELVGRLHKNRKIKILVVDDSLSLREMIVKLLAQHNYQIFTASDGYEALSVIAQQPDIQLMLTDYRMPNMDGIALTMAVRKQYSMSQMSIIGISVVETDQLSIEFIKNGANDFLTKPISPAQLICRITQNIEMLEHIQSLNKLAFFDHLTNTFNRRYFFTAGAQQINDAIQAGTPCIVAMIDIDHFKRINDTYGHECGDIVLTQFAQLLLTAFDHALVARIGGEEFALLFINNTQAEIGEQLEPFRLQLAGTRLSCLDETALQITISIGFAQSTTESLESLLKNADKNLYRAKHQGRNQVVG